MTVRVGVIGVGVMGADHARILAEEVSGGGVAAIFDADRPRAKAIADASGAAEVAESPAALIRSARVDAVLIASPDATHAELVRLCLAARKPVLCEKPLAPSSAECLGLIAEEARLGRRLIQVGFMRRFDPSYVAMREVAASMALGRPLMLHCAHRNVSAPPWFTSDMAIANSAPHEFDIARFLFDADIAEISVFQPQTSNAGARVKPVFLVMRTTGGALVDVEINNNAHYGYDVAAELVCELGATALAPSAVGATSEAGARRAAYPLDWRPRFAEAYRRQDQAWVRAVAADAPAPAAASAWDGYAAQRIAEAGLAALAEGRAVHIEMAERPRLYAAVAP
jgi:myo-inositol 2-dehydrogenase/D-chiro-inositol 1-dehydrogenase